MSIILSNTQSVHDSSKLILLAPYLFAIFLFILNRFYDFLTRQINIKKEIKRNQLFIFEWIKLIEPQVLKQKGVLNELVNSLKVDELTNFNRIQFHSDKLTLVSSLDKLNTFYTNKRGGRQDLVTAYFKLENSITYLVHKQENLVNFFDLNTKDILQISKDWDEEMHTFNNVIQKFIHSSSSNPDINHVLEDFHNFIIKGEFRGIGTPIPKLIEKLVNPVSEYLVKIFDLIEKDEFFFKCGETVRRLHVISMRYEVSKSTGIKNYERLSIELGDAITNLKETKQDLEKYRFKNILFLK